MTLLGHPASEISILWREQMKPALKPEYHALCSSEMKSSAKFLFGKDLAKQVCDVKETHRKGNTVGSSKGHSRGYRHDSWSTKKENHNDSGSYARPPFLGKGNFCHAEVASSFNQVRNSCDFSAILSSRYRRSFKPVET